MRFLVEYRFVLSLACSVGAGVAGLHAWPFPAENVFLALIQARAARRSTPACRTLYATVWFSTPFFADQRRLLVPLHLRRAVGSADDVAAAAAVSRAGDARGSLSVLGERTVRPRRSAPSAPTWLTIPERGLYTGMVIVGAIGTGKTSACMYPYVEQLLGYRANDPARSSAA